MNSIDKTIFSDAIRMAVAGDKYSAHIQLQKLTFTNQSDVDVWLWMAFTASTFDDAQTSIDLAADLTDELDDTKIEEARQWLSRARLSPSIERVPPPSTVFPSYYRSNNFYAPPSQSSQAIQPYGYQAQQSYGAMQPYGYQAAPPATVQGYGYGMSYVRCPFCQTAAPPAIKSRTSTAGWLTFGGLLVFFPPMCWIGFLIRENYKVCSVCTRRLN